MKKNIIIPIKTITEFHLLLGLSRPNHPLISLVDYSKINQLSTGVALSFYVIAMKRGVRKLFYGQQQYDFGEGIMFFMSPNQILKTDHEENKTSEHTGWILFIHPDFLWRSSLAKTIKQYKYFGYSVNEALFLSESEEVIVNNIISNVRQECQVNIDELSQKIIISQIETLLNYAERYYQRQFTTRKIANHQILNRLEDLLNDYFANAENIKAGLLTVRYVSERLNLSPNYLSSLLKIHTGKSTQQHIQSKLIDIAKEKLSTTALSVSEVAYDLGFEHPQSFSKLFKTKTNQSPIKFRNSFNPSKEK